MSKAAQKTFEELKTRRQGWTRQELLGLLDGTYMERREARHGTLYFRRKYFWGKVMVPNHRALKQYVGDNVRKVLTRLIDTDGETAVFEL